jgi:hypothetical protein
MLVGLAVVSVAPLSGAPNRPRQPEHAEAWFPFCVSFEYAATFQGNLVTWPIKKRRESDGGSDMVEHGD